MSLKIETVSRASEKGKLNEEWLVVKNEGDKVFNLAGCSISVSRGKQRPRVVTTFKPGLVLKPGERVRLVTGSSGKKSHGEAPEEEGIRNVHLYLKAPYLDRPGLTVHLMNRQLELCRTAVT